MRMRSREQAARQPSPPPRQGFWHRVIAAFGPDPLGRDDLPVACHPRSFTGCEWPAHARP
jgi:hypothetical protein